MFSSQICLVAFLFFQLNVRQSALVRAPLTVCLSADFCTRQPKNWVVADPRPTRHRLTFRAPRRQDSPPAPRIDPPMNYQVTRGFRIPSIIKPKDHQQRQQGQDKYKPLTTASQLVRLFTSPISQIQYKFTPHMSDAALGPRPVCVLDMIDSANFLSSSTGG